MYFLLYPGIYDAMIGFRSLPTLSQPTLCKHIWQLTYAIANNRNDSQQSSCPFRMKTTIICQAQLFRMLIPSPITEVAGNSRISALLQIAQYNTLKHGYKAKSCHDYQSPSCKTRKMPTNLDKMWLIHHDLHAQNGRQHVVTCRSA